MVIDSIKHIMRHRQVLAPGFLIHSNNTSEATKGLTKFFGFSCASLATLDFGTTNEFGAGGTALNSARADQPRRLLKEGSRGGKAPTFCVGFWKNQRKKVKIPKIVL
jgi:hypothetical protein